MCWAAQVALALGEPVKTSRPTAMPDGTADSASEMKVLGTATSETSASGGLQRTSGLSMASGQPQSPKGRQVAILAAPGTDAAQLKAFAAAIKAAGAFYMIVGPHLGMLDGISEEATKTFANTASVLFDAVYVPGGASAIAMLKQHGDPRAFIAEAYKHGKAIAATGEGVDLVAMALPEGAEVRADGQAAENLGIVTQQSGSDWTAAAEKFLTAISKHRNFDRTDVDRVPA